MSKKRFLKQIKSFKSLIHIHKDKIDREKNQTNSRQKSDKILGKRNSGFLDEITKAKKGLNRGG